MREQAGLGEHGLGHLGEIGERRGMPQPVEFLARHAIAQLRLVAEGEQGLLAAGLLAGAGDGEDLLAREERLHILLRRVGEGAVVADVAAELGQRNEDLARIGHRAAVEGVAAPAGEVHEAGQIGHLDHGIGFFRGEARALGEPLQNSMAGHVVKGSSVGRLLPEQGAGAGRISGRARRRCGRRGMAA